MFPLTSRAKRPYTWPWLSDTPLPLHPFAIVAVGERARGAFLPFSRSGRALMRILFALTYYRPYISGVTICVQRLAESLAARGHQVSVLTSRYDDGLPASENMAGVEISRLPVRFWISKGALMKGYVSAAGEMIRRHDVVVMNLPNTPIEALALPRLARAAARPIVALYQCDVVLPPGAFNRVVQAGVGICNRLAARRVDRVATHTDDYARHSRLLRDFPGKVEVTPPPIDVPLVDPLRARDLRLRLGAGMDNPRCVGFVARLAAEKGVDTLLKALPMVEAALGPTRLLMVGECDRVIGEGACLRGLAPLIRAQGDRVRLLGVLPPEEMADFYAACDATALPSRNATESFGMVQVESMLCGTPVVASDLPGVRAPVRTTGMGRIVPVGDPRALGEALVDVLSHPERFRRPREEIERHYSMDRTVAAYEELLGSLVRRDATRRPPALAGDFVHSSSRDQLREHLRELPAFRALVRSVECSLMEGVAPLRQPVLDLGCGDGHFATMAFSSPLFAGIDLEAPREAAERRAHRHALRADATRLPFVDASFATVLANSSLEHIPAMGEALAEAVRVLQSGGRLILTTPSDRFADMLLGASLLGGLGLGRAAKAYGEWFNRRSRHYHTDSPETWLRRLEELGLRVERWQYYLTPRAHRAFDAAHYLGLPRLLCRRLTGRWTPLPNPAVNALFHLWLRRHASAEARPSGPYLFFVARKP
jgi:glycosyltransferase involved in cell wall biosynthesis/SAM-dependent methyltransferase